MSLLQVPRKSNLRLQRVTLFFYMFCLCESKVISFSFYFSFSLSWTQRESTMLNRFLIAVSSFSFYHLKGIITRAKSSYRSLEEDLYTSLALTPLAGGHTKFHFNGVVLQLKKKKRRIKKKFTHTQSIYIFYFLFFSLYPCIHMKRETKNKKKNFSNEPAKSFSNEMKHTNILFFVLFTFTFLFN